MLCYADNYQFGRILPNYLTDDLCLGIEVLFVRHWNPVEEQVVLDVPGELLNDIRHVADLLLQLLDLVLELLGLLHGRVDLLAAQSRYRIVELTGIRTVNKEVFLCFLLS